jgi:chromosomal replication initiation ATPase DnaA
VPPATAAYPDIAAFAPSLKAIGSQPLATRIAVARGERALAICDGLIDIAAALFNVSGKELRRAGRTGLGVSRVRQIAMYVGHVVLGLSMNEIGRGFGRDRTTVLYACHLVEDLRDEPDFDRIVSTVEKVAIAAFRERGAI